MNLSRFGAPFSSVQYRPHNWCYQPCSKTSLAPSSFQVPLLRSRPDPKSAAFASAKFALRGLAQSLARAYGPQGVHIAHVIIDGVIWGERAEKTFEMSENQCMQADAIADTYMTLIQQQPSSWTHELDLRPYKEQF